MVGETPDLKFEGGVTETRRQERPQYEPPKKVESIQESEIQKETFDMSPDMISDADFFASGSLEEIVDINSNSVHFGRVEVNIDSEEESALRQVYDFDELRMKFENKARDLAVLYAQPLEDNFFSSSLRNLIEYYSG